MTTSDYTTNCHICGRIIDKRERTEGGDPFGAELSDGRWACSVECWDEELTAITAREGILAKLREPDAAMVEAVAFEICESDPRNASCYCMTKAKAIIAHVAATLADTEGR